MDGNHLLQFPSEKVKLQIQKNTLQEKRMQFFEKANELIQLGGL